jgi:hypothetical protein
MIVLLLVLVWLLVCTVVGLGLSLLGASWGWVVAGVLAAAIVGAVVAVAAHAVVSLAGGWG